MQHASVGDWSIGQGARLGCGLYLACAQAIGGAQATQLDDASIIELMLMHPRCRAGEGRCGPNILSASPTGIRN